MGNASTLMLKNGDIVTDTKNFARDLYFIKTLTDNNSKTFRITKL